MIDERKVNEEIEGAPSTTVSQATLITGRDDILILNSLKIPSIQILTTLTDVKLSHLTHLEINNAELECLEGFPHLPKLTKLELRGNNISGGLDALVDAKLNQLHTLDLSDNKIKYLKDVHTLSQLISLSILTLQGNPVTRAPPYKNTVLQLMPKLTRLDGKDREYTASGETKLDDEETTQEMEVLFDLDSAYEAKSPKRNLKKRQRVGPPPQDKKIYLLQSSSYYNYHNTRKNGPIIVPSFPDDVDYGIDTDELHSTYQYTSEVNPPTKRHRAVHKDPIPTPLSQPGNSSPTSAHGIHPSKFAANYSDDSTKEDDVDTSNSESAGGNEEGDDPEGGEGDGEGGPTIGPTAPQDSISFLGEMHIGATVGGTQAAGTTDATVAGQ